MRNQLTAFGPVTTEHIAMLAKKYPQITSLADRFTSGGLGARKL
jgi:hypothetical protein